jgi:hypothetical protein
MTLPDERNPSILRLTLMDGRLPLVRNVAVRLDRHHQGAAVLQLELERSVRTHHHPQRAYPGSIERDYRVANHTAACVNHGARDGALDRCGNTYATCVWPTAHPDPELDPLGYLLAFGQRKIDTLRDESRRCSEKSIRSSRNNLELIGSTIVAGGGETPRVTFQRHIDSRDRCTGAVFDGATQRCTALLRGRSHSEQCDVRQ